MLLKGLEQTECPAEEGRPLALVFAGVDCLVLGGVWLEVRVRVGKPLKMGIVLSRFSHSIAYEVKEQ